MHKTKDPPRCEESIEGYRIIPQNLKKYTYNPGYRVPPCVSSTKARGRIGKTATFTHRNRTLVINNATASNAQFVANREVGSTSKLDTTEALELGITIPSNSTSWVSRRDRHMQLINSSILGKEACARGEVLEYSQRQKFPDRKQKDKQKPNKNFQLFIGGIEKSSSLTLAEPGLSSYYLDVDGLRFQVLNGGSKLRRVSSRYMLTQCTFLTNGFLRCIRYGADNTEQDSYWRCNVCSK